MTKFANAPETIANAPTDPTGDNLMLALVQTHAAKFRWRPLPSPTRLRLMAAAPALALVVAACSGTVDGYPASTYVTPPTVPPASAAPAATVSPTATGAALHLSARNIAFDTDHLEAPAGQPFMLEFDNNDAGIPHNVEIKGPNGASLFRGQIINGPSTASYSVPALAAGDYLFVCDVHPEMTGTLTVR